jgi:hypothetical protein
LRIGLFKKSPMPFDTVIGIVTIKMPVLTET